MIMSRIMNCSLYLSRSMLLMFNTVGDIRISCAVKVPVSRLMRIIRGRAETRFQEGNSMLTKTQ
jgi:hypothetical protein